MMRVTDWEGRIVRFPFPCRTIVRLLCSFVKVIKVEPFFKFREHISMFHMLNKRVSFSLVGQVPSHHFCFLKFSQPFLGICSFHQNGLLKRLLPNPFGIFIEIALNTEINWGGQLYFDQQYIITLNLPFQYTFFNSFGQRALVAYVNTEFL